MSDTYKGKPCRSSEMQIGDTLFTVISVQAESAKETAEAKIRKLILNTAELKKNSQIRAI